MRFRFEAAGPTDLVVAFQRVRTGSVLRRFVLRDASPTRTQDVRWNGVTAKRRSAADGGYRVLISPRGASPRRAAGFVLHQHVYPVRGRHTFRGAVGRFGVPRNGGRTHEGFDIVAACGTPLVAVRAGRVRRVGYHARLYGYYVLLAGSLEHRDYFYAHLPRPAGVRRGQLVRTGQRIGSVGATGNARSIGCHLHFEIHERGRPVNPEGSLRKWDTWS